MNVMRGGVGVLVAGLVVTGLGGCGGTADGNEPPAGSAASESGFARVVNVQVRPIEAERFVEQVRLTGVVRADRDVVVGAEEPGRVVEVLVQKGQLVAAGDPLVRLNSELIQAQVDEAESRATLAEETWQRRRRLWEEDRVGTELAYLEAQATARQTAAVVRSLRERRGRTVVRAPFAGVVEDWSVELGSLVAPGSPIARVVDLTPLEVVSGVPERYAADIKPGATVSVTFDAVTGSSFEGRVRFVGSTVDPQSRTFPIEVTLPSSSGAIKPEMVANVSVERRAIDDALVAPQDAVVRVEDGYVVYVVTGATGAETVEARRVTVRASQANRVVLEGDIAAGDRIVIAGQQQLAAGDRVRIVEGR
jgi:RND family efflux transporter MFP subunit